MAKNTSKNTRKSANLLPAFFRTEKNTKFLSSTIDQLIKVPSLERIDGYVGSKLSQNYNPKTDIYIPESLPMREKYQLEPALVVKRIDQSIKSVYGYTDLISQVEYYGGNVNNLDRLFRPKFYSYDPRVDWDKFINFREYYWLPMGPASVTVSGLQRDTVSTFTVTDTPDGDFLIFTPDGLTPDPLVTFYRGMTYVLNVNSVHTVYIKTDAVPGTDSIYNTNVTGNGTNQIVITVDSQTPSVLFYAAEDNQLASGRILIKTIDENSELNVEKEILGKSQYKSGNGVEFINGLKVRFVGDVTPVNYANKEFIVEGVGDKIRLVEFSSLTTPINLNPTIDPDFDQTPFDEYPFDNFKNIPEDPEYITINRASRDLNPWSRYNRWFHKDVIDASANANGYLPEYPADKQGRRPIIEFQPDLQLWNFGTDSIGIVDYIDDITVDAFSTVEGSYGYYIDSEKLEDGQRVIFNADTDPLVKGKIFEVTFSIFEGKQKLNLTEVITPQTGNSVVVRGGSNFAGTSWWFNGTEWINGQQRNGINQAPLFDLFDRYGHSYSDKTYYDSEFSGNKIFGYAIGTGVNDAVLGFPLQYSAESIGSVSSYLFTNYLNSDSILLVGTTEPIPTVDTYVRINKDNSTELVNAWTEAAEYKIPVEQFQVITTSVSQIEVTVFDNPTSILDLEIEVFVEDIKQNLGQDYELTSSNNRLFVAFVKSVDGTVDPKRVLLRCYTSTTPNQLGTYGIPLNMTNNPLNGFIKNFTLSELSDHVKSMVDRNPAFNGDFPGVSNLKSLPGISKYGTRLISNQNPLSFAQMFISNPEHNLINAARAVALDYYQFKINLIKFASQVGNSVLTPPDVLDQALAEMNGNKNSTFPYAYSDMLGAGNNNVTTVYTVTDSRNKEYSISSIFNPSVLSTRSVIVYRTSINGVTEQLVHGKDYHFPSFNSSVYLDIELVKNDIITIKDYISTVGTYVPPTPTKLGLYPKYEPAIYVDYSYAGSPQKVIQGHDGSLTVAFSKPGEEHDYRDLVLLEFETRIYNNLKVDYNPELININKILPGVFRDSEYAYQEIFNMVQSDFLKWTSTYGLDFTTNSTYDINNYKTYNFKSAQDYLFGQQLPGNWRAIYKMYFDTDRPNTHPWEMLGFSIKPTWWDSEYGTAPYTSGNWNMWEDLEKGLIRQGDRAGIDPVYARPGLSQVIPVDDSGNIVDVRDWAGLALNDSIINTNQDWSFGDHGPVETAWRRSSLWPFAVQVISALAKPADYASMMFDTSRLLKDVTGQYNYGVDETFLNPSNVLIFSDVDSTGNVILSSGYSVWVVEAGNRRSAQYVNDLKTDLSLIDFNLFYKAGGFLSKDKLDITIDSVSPNTSNPGVLLPNEDYTLHFNVSPPVKSVAISGIIVEKKNAKFSIKGYDKKFPFFIINKPLRTANGSALTVGGKSEPFLTWRTGAFYQVGQVVYYQYSYFRVVTSHTAGNTFAPENFTQLDSLATVGGATVLVSKQFSEDDTIIPYGTEYDTIQEVYDLIVGYGYWLTNQGFIFDNYSKDLNQVIDWNFTGKEFLYWTTQNWASSSVITLSPFAASIKYQFTDAVVDNVLNSFYEYSLLKADGQPFPVTEFSLSREDKVCTIETKNDVDGLFFARLNLVQKEHAIVLNNYSMFNDVIYDIETGYRQSRIKLAGFRTGDWNGEFLSPGFIYDNAQIEDWIPYTDYYAADVVKYVGNYYSSNTNLPGTAKFNFNDWTLLGEKPVAQLLPNFDYKINQFEDFYSLDIDNFDSAQQKMAQHLIGYTPRPYLDNIFVNPIAQYKFYQGFIREKGTKNAIDKLAKASIHNLQGQLTYNEEWAFRIGNYGNFTSYNELEFPLREGDFLENSQIVKFVDVSPTLPNDLISYITPNDIPIKSEGYSSDAVFAVENSTYSDNSLVLPTAGFVRIDDVTATAYNKNSLLDIANNSEIQDGDTIWVGFRDDGQWDVYRYTVQRALVIDSEVTSAGSELTFTTDSFHRLAEGDVVSVSGLTNGTDGVYSVQSVISLTQFTVSTALSVVQPSEKEALLFKFISVRVTEPDNISNLQNLVTFSEGDLVWSDSNGSGKWAVYRKIKNFSTSTIVIPPVEQDQESQKYGIKIATQSGSDILAVAAPDYYSNSQQGYGWVVVYELVENTLTKIFGYSVNDTTVPNTYLGGELTGLGTALVYDTETDSLFAGAPNIDLVKITGIDRQDRQEVHLPGSIITGPSDSGFGSSLYLSKTTATNKVMLVGAPLENVQIGSVYAYNLLCTATIVTTTSTVINTTSSVVGDKFGYDVAGNAAGTLVAISAPGTNNGTGVVYVYSTTSSGRVAYDLEQTIIPPSVCGSGDKFGSSVVMSDNGVYLFVSSTLVSDRKSGIGKVFVYKYSNGIYSLNQTIDNPSNDINLNFGYDLAINDDATTLVVTGRGDNNYIGITIDGGDTTFDNSTCKFGELVVGSGSAYVFNRYSDKFIYSEELFDSNTLESNTMYGTSVAISSNQIFIGAPGKRSNGVSVGGIYQFAGATNSSSGWEEYRVQDDLVDISKIKRAVTIDALNQKVVDYLDIIDPAKGKISGLADQEVRYKTAFDPSVYSIGVQGVVVDNEASWTEEHLGELWWDLSSVKYLWYEQSDLEYRKNRWGDLFPGASIDVYEWVQSEYLPSQWAALADTTEGLSKGISGQPKYPENNVISVKQYYNSLNGSMTNVYFYWVKNKVTLPASSSRRLPASDVARLIFDPAAYGIKYLSILDSNAVAVTNVAESLSQNNVYLNVAKDEIDNIINRHTEWLLIAEGDENRMPNTLLNKKLIDSLLGRDSLGNPVPDPNLPDRTRYGIGIRPRQSMFKNRIEALRNAIEYTNSVLAQTVTTETINFTNLNSKDEIPDIESREYDVQVENEEGLYDIITNYLVQAELACTVENGRIVEVTITNPGFGYIVPPLVEIVNDTSGAVLLTEIDGDGKVVSVTIEQTGEGLLSAPELKVRPFTAVVTVDLNSGNRWAIYQWEHDTWNKIRTQDFDTTLFWNYVDWRASTYDAAKPLAETVEETYLLDTIDVATGSYVKVMNQGNGRFVILEKVSTGAGTFSADYDLIYSEKGTINLSENLWNKQNSSYNFDYLYTYDETLYDQGSEVELEKILYAIKDDIFVGPLKVYWNKFFFKAVRYAMSEQIFLDWAFKTSFIDVKNLAGSLSQRPVYKFQNSQYYEDYLNEVKPYHTKVRNYLVDYEVVEPTQTYTTDFDLPPYYDRNTTSFIPTDLGDPLLDVYPRKGWADNYTYSIGTITVEDGGSGYTTVPDVRIIPALGDSVTRSATAIAYISRGSVIEIEVTDPGAGYTKTPTVVIAGGGSSSLITARAYPHLVNGKVRSNTIGIKLDRVSGLREIGETTVTDRIVCDGVKFKWTLSWAAENKKSNITVTQDGINIFSTEYNIETYTEVSNGYHKLFSDLVLTFVPTRGAVIEITYIKKIDLYTAADRISDYYNPTDGMQGAEADQLMNGVDYPGTQINTLPFSYTANWDMLPYTGILWAEDDPERSLDTVIDGGDLAYTMATGLNPEDIILDGDAFLSSNVSHGPEEFVPGQVFESVGITVYTREPFGSPMIVQSITEILTTTSTTEVSLRMMPPSTSSVMISYNNRVLNYGEDYLVDVPNKTVTISTQTETGIAAITVLGVGGTNYGSYGSVVVSGVSTAVISNGIPNLKNVGSVYVTVNGVSTTNYVLNSLGLTVTGLSTGTNTVQAWFWESPYKGYSEVVEQLITTQSWVFEYELSQYPGDLEPVNAHAIVEVNKVRLTPPNTVYYSVEEGQYIFDIDPNGTYPMGVYDLGSIQVFVNGVKVRNAIDFILDQPNSQIIFPVGVLKAGDALAITDLYHGDYRFEDGKLIFNTNRYIPANNSILKVITYTNHDADLIRTEVFVAGSSRRYTMSREVFNDDYVWVTVAGNPLINGIDYQIDNDHRTVLVDVNYPMLPTDTVVIMSMTDVNANYVLAYRSFKDILNRTSYKRLSDINTTKLLEPLYTTSTSIIVENALILSKPSPEKNVPGVVLVAGERIEYMELSGNTLSKLKRATLGTGPKEVYPVGTKVVDYGIRQTIPYKEVLNVNTATMTDVSNTSFIIEEMGIKAGNRITTESLIKGSAGSTVTNYDSQLRVYYGGIPLRKEGIYVHDQNYLYDPIESNILGSTSTVDVLPDTVILGNAYVVTATNQVWVYTNSDFEGAVNGYEYSGLTYLPPEYEITTVTNTSTRLTLLLPQERLFTGTYITVVQHQISKDWYASTGTSMLDDLGEVATFLRDRPFALPDKYYYGQS